MRTAWVLQGLGFLILTIALFVLFDTENPGTEPNLTTNQDMPMEQLTLEVRSPAFQNKQPIPSKYTCDGENISPPLAIENIPKEALSLVLIVEDPDVPKHLREDGMWNHWVVFNIPPTVTRIGEGEPPKGVSGITTSNTLAYTGPCPPDKTHRYYFKIFALDTELALQEGATKEEVLETMNGHVIATGELMGTYTRQ